MVYVQFYHKDLSGRLSEALGDRSVVILDGRNSEAEWITIAKQMCKKRKYLAWQIFKGESFQNSKALGALHLEGLE